MNLFENVDYIVKSLRLKAIKHLDATARVDTNRLVGFHECCNLADTLEHQFKLITQEDVRL